MVGPGGHKTAGFDIFIQTRQSLNEYDRALSAKH